MGTPDAAHSHLDSAAPSHRWLHNILVSVSGSCTTNRNKCVYYLSVLCQDFTKEYMDIARKCEDFAKGLLDRCTTKHEVQTLLQTR